MRARSDAMREAKGDAMHGARRQACEATHETRRGARRGMRRATRRGASRACLAPLLAALALGCEGDGSGGGDGLVIRSDLTVEGCTPIPALSPFPSGLDLLSQQSGLATLVQLQPNAIVVFDLDQDPDRPRIVSVAALGLDSDGDGQDDADAIQPILGFPLYPLPGEIQAQDDALALLSTSNYEQVVAVDPVTGALVELEVDVPAAVPEDRYPLLPEPGARARRTGISTLACVVPPEPVDSSGRAIAIDPRCDPDEPAFLTTLTAGKAVAGDRLFVATSNLFRGTRFFPGTVLVYEWDRGPGGLVVRPSVDTPFLFTTGFNPTGLVRVVTPGGRELVLVTVTGAIATGSGSSNVLTEGAIDVIDPSGPRIVATIPLGLAGPSFDAPAVDPGGRTAWLGATSEREVYAVDLRPLDDPALYTQGGAPVILDGLTLGFDDARIFTADHPLELPRRNDGRASGSCEGFTDVTTNSAGTAVFASDFCDGTLTRIELALDGQAPMPYPRDRFQVVAQSNAFAPNDAVGEARAPSLVAARPGIPGVDYTTPDVLVVVGQPDGQLCGVRIESP